MGACNDLIYLTARPYADGDLTFDLPVNDAELTGASYMSSYEGRNGVVKFDGAGKDVYKRQDKGYIQTAVVQIFLNDLIQLEQEGLVCLAERTFFRCRDYSGI